MINTSILLEKYLQNYRFKMAEPYLIGDVLDFGGNNRELKKLVKGKYLVVNYDRSLMDNTHFDTIVSLAVIEHIPVKEVENIFKEFKIVLNKKGRIFLTIPTKMAKPVLKIMAFVGILDKENMGEHKHYWDEKDLRYLAKKAGFVVKKYKKFQFGFNQLAILEHI